MGQQELDKTRLYLYCSSSIIDWKEKIKKKFNLPEWCCNWKNLWKSVIFFGLYSGKDFKRFFFHQGKKIIVWCGTDILYLEQKQNWWRKYILKLFKVDHVCENEIQQKLLNGLGIQARIHYNFYENPDDFPVGFKPSKTPHVYLTCHGGKEPEYAKQQNKISWLKRFCQQVPEITFHIYGIKEPDFYNIKYHGQVSNEQFNQEIKNYHAALRLHEFDGFSETLAKSILLGQYPITFIPYFKIAYAQDGLALLYHLSDLKSKTEPNPAREYWYQQITKPLFR